MMRRAVLLALLAGAPASAFLTASVARAPVVARSSPADDFDAVSPGAAIAQIKADMKAAQERGDADTVVTLMGTLLAMEGAYEGEGGAGGSSSEGRCAD